MDDKKYISNFPTLAICFNGDNLEECKKFTNHRDIMIGDDGKPKLYSSLVYSEEELKPGDFIIKDKFHSGFYKMKKEEFLSKFKLMEEWLSSLLLLRNYYEYKYNG